MISTHTFTATYPIILLVVCVRVCVHVCVRVYIVVNTIKSAPSEGGMATRCRHQISFSRESEETDQQGTTQCGLCQGHHAQMSEPRTWKSEQAQLTARTLNIETSQIVCRPCRDDITRLAKNPRWIRKLSVCSMQDCKMTSNIQRLNVPLNN